jgi:exosortase/archaeosortase family protein
VLHATARSVPRRGLAATLDRELTLPFVPVLGGLFLLVLVGFGVSYRSLLPLADGESPDALLLALPLVGLLLLALTLSGSSRHGNEVAINLVFAAPATLLFLMILLWLPPRYASVYWVYRIDLLALPLLVGVAVILLFGLPALLRSWGAFLLLLLGWQPVFDRLVGVVADPLARADAWAVGLLAAPFAAHASRTGQLFVVGPHGDRSVAISSACAGLAAIFSMALVGAFLGRAVKGKRRRKAAWLAAAIALVLAVNLVRMTAIVVVADRVGLGPALSVFHATAGVALFSVSLLAMLLLLRRFGLQLSLPAMRTAPPVRMKARGAVVVGTVLASLALMGIWAETGFGFYGPGSFASTPVLHADDLLPGSSGVARVQSEALPWIDVLFGDGARSWQYDYAVAGTTGIGAQVVVAPHLTQIASYGALDCFLFHRYRIRATKRVTLKNGGTALLAAISVGKSDIATISWSQPVRLAGKNQWRRVILFQYLDGKPVRDDFKPSLSRRVGNWLLNTLAPYGSTSPPKRYRQTEKELQAYANGFAVRDAP